MLHSGNLIWNLKKIRSKRIVVYQEPSSRFLVSRLSKPTGELEACLEPYLVLMKKFELVYPVVVGEQGRSAGSSLA